MCVVCVSSLGLAVCGSRMQFNQSCAASSFIQKSLVDGYPRLRSLLLSTLSKLRRNTEHRGGRSSAGTTSDHRLVGGGGSIGVGGRPEDADELLAAAQPLLEVYLARSLSRLNEPVRVVLCVCGWHACSCGR